MADEHPNAQLLRRLYDAYARRDKDAICELIAEDCTWHIPGRGPYSGDYQGRDAIIELFRSLMRLSKGTAVIRLDDVIADDRYAVALQTGTGTIDGRHAELQECLVHTIRDGRVVSMREFQFDLYAADAWFG